MLSRSAWARTAKPPRGETSNKKTSTKRCSFFQVHFQGLSRLRRVAAVRAPRGPPAALRRCPALRLAASATGGARLLSRLRRVAAALASGHPVPASAGRWSPAPGAVKHTCAHLCQSQINMIAAGIFSRTGFRTCFRHTDLSSVKFTKTCYGIQIVVKHKRIERSKLLRVFLLSCNSTQALSKPLVANEPLFSFAQMCS